ncbi:MAG: DUF3943 domain-containing protein [Parabacteroides sp.]|nr:DUF3943 domain-containing protein [Parabacteroides sp.]
MEGSRAHVPGKQGKRYIVVLFLWLVQVWSLNARNETDLPGTVAESDTFLVQAGAVKMDTVFPAAARPGNRQPPVVRTIYDYPYSMTANYPDYKRLALNTGVLFGAGILTLGVLQLLPDDATAWNKKEIRQVPFFRRWVNNVKKGPVWDKDNFVFNYILHPYGGAAYYMSARSQGFNVLYSFLYSAAVSTFFWEYGVEAFMEIPSIQDLIITPIAGVLIGEGFYILKRHIVANGYELFGSRLAGNVAAYLIDPVNEVIGIFAGNPERKKKYLVNSRLVINPVAYTYSPGEMAFGLTLSRAF